MEPPSTNPSRPLARGPARSSTPLMEVQVYRPGSGLALSILLLPSVATLLTSVVALNTAGRVPVWLPFLLLVSALWLPVLWLGMQSVRTSMLGIAVGRPWQRWNEVPWAAIERVEQAGLALRITASDDRRLSIWPHLLREGRRLERELLLRLPPNVLAGTLPAKAQAIMIGTNARSSGRITGTLYAQAQRRWQSTAAVACLLAPAALVTSFIALPRAPAIALVPACCLLEVVTLGLFLTVLQRVTMDERGVRVSGPLRRGARSMRWDDVELIEHSPRDRMLRLRGAKKLISLGPGILPEPQSTLMHAYLRDYCLNRHVPIVERRWLL